MRVTPILGVAFAVAALSACGRPVSNVETPPRVFVPQVSSDLRAPDRTPGQPRLSALRADNDQAPRRDSPVATYSRYDGRGPGDAAIPSGVRVDGDEATLAEAAKAATVPGQGRVPSRDVVELGLSPDRRAAGSDTRQASLSDRARLRKAPAPAPRPITAAPRPIPRPTATAALPSPEPAVAPQPVLPPRPTIANLSAPSLSAPQALRDATPTAFPVPQTVEGSIPLGTLPASLGLANLKAAEAAVPAADTLERSSADASGTLGWSQAAALIRAGEVETIADIGEFEVLLTMCSGVGVISILPTPDALELIERPKVICGKSASLTSQ